MVGYLHLGDPGPLDEGQGRQKAVQFAVEIEIVDHLAAVGLQGAAVVVQLHAGDPGDQAIGQQGGQQPAQGRILAAVAPAAHQVKTLVQLLQQQRDVGRIVLQVAIEGDDHLAAAGVKTGCHRRRLAVIAPQPHRHQLRHCRRQLAQQLGGAIPGAVIHQHQLEAQPQGAHVAEDALHQWRQTLLLVEQGHHHR